MAGLDPGGPGEQAGIEEGDVIQQFDGQPVPDIRALWRHIGTAAQRRVVPVLLCRDSRQVTVQVTVGEEAEPVPSVEPAPLLAQPANKTFELGLTLAPADPGLRTRFQLPSDQGGLVVTGVSGGGAAADLEIAVGNVVVKVQRITVASEADLLRLLDGARAETRRHALLLLRSEAGTRWEALPLDP